MNSAIFPPQPWTDEQSLILLEAMQPKKPDFDLEQHIKKQAEHRNSLNNLADIQKHLGVSNSQMEELLAKFKEQHSI